MTLHFSDYASNSFSDYAPGAPPFNDSADMHMPEMGGSAHVHIPEMPAAHMTTSAAMTGGAGGGGRPTLKDYLDMMKANKMPLPGKQAEGKNRRHFVKILFIFFFK